MLSILKYEFIQQALLAVIAMSIFAPILGTFLILRRQSLLSDTLSHVSLAGIALGVLIGFSPTYATITVVIIAAIFLEYLRTIYKNFMELGTAILMSTGLAIAMVVMSKTSSSSLSLEQYLFGSIITININQVISLFLIALIIIFLTILFFRPLYIMTFDEHISFSEGLNIKLTSTLFNILTGVAISLMIPAVGALLVSTIIILPASISLTISKNFKSVIFSGIIICLLGMIAGIFISYYAETPASATITLIFITIFIAINLTNKIKHKGVI
ncbi:metal ABC transporter permease [Gemella sp. zg-1178]|uniref:metal ABC transporter permease n=1 Tax=Gemella sp. zg-1178 TaxID=2840372 RepID=UPI001C0518B2|nr:metal ABC transporter permease [Gemella sp. zg-1178]MBU0279093.1 metal ABC transporter permease [Gemella sp. zg-1178]